MLTALVLALLPAVDGFIVYLENDGPAVVDAPIMFTARVELEPGDERPDQVYYEWSDNASPPHRNTSELTHSLTATMLLSVNEPGKFGYFVMTVRVKEPRTILPDRTLGEHGSLYSITVNLNGGIELSQPAVPHRKPGHVSTANETELQVRFRDPHHFLDSATSIEYFWSVNDHSNPGPSKDPRLRFNFTQIGANFVRCISVAHFSRNDSLGLRDSTKWGMFLLNFNVDAPISKVNVTGDNWLKHGELLNITMRCNGTGPWNYCLYVHQGRYNVTGNETCSRPRTIAQCQLDIVRYLRDNGTYTLVSVLDNAVSRRVTPVTITVYTVVRASQLSYYLVPLSCALCALAFILFGSIRLIKSQRDYNLEIADFDFGHPESLQPSFGRRLVQSLWPGGVRRTTAVAAGAAPATETDAILPRGRSRRRSYGIVEGYEED